jgi:hypothetical protein
MAIGMAIVGFGGRAMIGAPLANILMNTPRARLVPGRPSLLWLGSTFFFMMVSAFRYRLPPAEWRQDGWSPLPAANTT